jgi:hypothetical protein
MEKFDKVYDSAVGAQTFQLANGHISTTAVYFEKEQLLAKIEATGSVSFFDCEGKLLQSATVPQEKEGKEVYTEVACAVESGAVLLKFPIVQWIDNYPHCDGEHDRWDARTVGYHVVCFDRDTQEVSVREEKR